MKTIKRETAAMRRTTISVTGDTGLVDHALPHGSMPRVVAASRGARHGSRYCSAGFTLVELLVVIAILATLMGMVVVTVGQFIGRAQEKATVSLFDRMTTWIEDYRSLTGGYPLDGLDSRVRATEGATLRGVAALYYQLNRSVIAEEIYGSRVRVREYPKVGQFEGRDVTEKDEEFPGAQEVLDGWGNAFHYDNTEDGRFRPQDGSVHYPPVDDEEHPIDPRTGELEDVGGAKPVKERGIQKLGYDLWSHGTEGHKEGDPSLPVASWNIRRFQQ